MGEKPYPLVALAVRLKTTVPHWRDHLAGSLLLCKPDTLLKWHRELVRRKWTVKRPNPGGRPRIDPEPEGWIVRLAGENSRWGFDRIHGELLKLGFTLDPKTVKNVMKRHRLQPAPQRGANSWRTFLGHYKHQMLAYDFFTVETLWLHTVYVLFFIDLNTRRVYLAGCTEEPNSAWITQQARQLTWQLEDERAGLPPLRFLIHDRDTKFSRSFEAVFAVAWIEPVLTALPFATGQRHCRTVDSLRTTGMLGPDHRSPSTASAQRAGGVYRLLQSAAPPSGHSAAYPDCDT